MDGARVAYAPAVRTTRTLPGSPWFCFSTIFHVLIGVLGFVFAGFPLAACTYAPRPFPPEIPELVAENEAAGDPFKGRFPLEQALEGLPEGKRLVSVITTDRGEIRCTLDPVSTPLAVANFVGLARGLRPFRDVSGNWVKQPFYDGLTWHRGIENQFIQAGERSPDGPGFVLQDEISPGQVFDRAGALAMANKGTTHSSSAQFFITVTDLPSLNGQYTIFGTCDDEHVVRAIARELDANKKPPPKIVSVEVTRE